MADNTPIKDQTLLVNQAIAAFAAKVRKEVEVAKAGSVNAENAQKLEGLTLNEIVELIAGTTGLTIQDVQDQLDTFVARTDNPHNVTATQVGLGSLDNFTTATKAETVGTVYSYVATEAQATFSGADQHAQTLVIGEGQVVFGTINGDRIPAADITVDYETDTVSIANYTAVAGDVVNLRIVRGDQFVTPAGTWSALEAFLAELVGSSPQTLNTIQEIASAITDNSDVIQLLEDSVANKAATTYVESEVLRLEGLIEAAEPVWATDAEALAGTETNKAMSPATTKVVRDAIETDVADGFSDLQSAFESSIAYFSGQLVHYFTLDKAAGAETTLQIVFSVNGAADLTYTAMDITSIATLQAALDLEEDYALTVSEVSGMYIFTGTGGDQIELKSHTYA